MPVALAEGPDEIHEFVEVVIHMPTTMHNDLKDRANQRNLPGVAELIRRALMIDYECHEHALFGGDIIIRQPDGSEEVYPFS